MFREVVIQAAQILAARDFRECQTMSASKVTSQNPEEVQCQNPEEVQCHCKLTPTLGCRCSYSLMITNHYVQKLQDNKM